MEKLGEELLLDILVRIPIPCLIQYKCINKKWLSLISDPQFVRAKLKTSLLQQHPTSSYRLLLSSIPINSVNYEALADEEVVPTAAITQLDYPATVIAEKTSGISFIGSCDGLVCLLLEETDDGVSFIVWNPTTRQSRALPKPKDINVSLNNGEFFYGFGYDSVMDDYKLLVGRCDGDAAEIFSLNTDSWKHLEDCCTGKVVRAEGIYWNGSLHWLSTTGDDKDNLECKITSFDMREDKFRYDAIPLPCPHPDGLGVTIEDCLFVYQGDDSLHFEAWIMKEDGCSWSKEFSFSTESLPTNKYWTKFITFTRDKKMVFDYCGWEVCIYDPERRSYRCFEARNDDDYFESCITYVESLVSPCAKAG